MEKILITEVINDKGLEILNHSNFNIDIELEMDKKRFISILPNYTCLIVKTLTIVDKDVIDAGRNLKCIGRIGVGLDNIDIEYARLKNIPVFFSPHGNTIPTAEHAIGMILHLAKRFHAGHKMVHEGKWERDTYRTMQLYGKTLGIIGLGRIGKAVAKRAHAFGMNVIAYDPYIGDNDFIIVDAISKSFEEVISESDFLTLHVPLSEETINMISANELKKMKKNVILINCSRGKVVNEIDLANALKSETIFAAGIDTFPKEPPIGSRLLEVENCILTPHIASYTPEAKIQTSIELALVIKEFLINKVIKNCGNFDRNSFKTNG